MDDQLKRLEAITNRLEAVAQKISSSSPASSTVNGHSNVNNGTADELDHLPILRDYDTIINESVQPFLNSSKKIGGDLTTMTDHVQRLFAAQQAFIKRAAQSKKPNDQQIMEIIKPQSNEIEAISSMFEMKAQTNKD